MSLLSLQDVGKIYVSENSVAVGIRGVSLAFDKGEFVAVTGKSGSGKSTLLNVISGMDTYEEGELFVEGNPTSHFLQPDWEEYREKYVSFIFQDYNIIDSFTVLQNVELSLMHIEDKSERRRIALELISRVGLSSHAKHKGSKLSGGQKQRTVIARALAKDSPIILADEPTGNLDSATSREIIELLREVSRDKLLIMVTHNFEQVSEYATRHVRIFDGAVESDVAIRERADSEIEAEAHRNGTEIAEASTKDASAKKRSELWSSVKNGVTLGKTVFLSKPRLSTFLCLLMIIGTLGIFVVTSVTDASGLFKDYYMFNHIDGRLVLTTQSGEVLTEEAVKKLAEEYGAEDYLRFDQLLDAEYNGHIAVPSSDYYEYLHLKYAFREDFGDATLGRYPAENDEILLYLPISYQPNFGKDEIITDRVEISGASFRVVGIKYYYDNNIEPKCLFTEEGFRVATAVYYVTTASTVSSKAAFVSDNHSEDIYINRILPSFDIPSDKIYLDSPRYESLTSSAASGEYDLLIGVNAVYYEFNYFYGSSSKSYNFSRSFGMSDVTDTAPADLAANYGQSVLYVSDDILCEIAEEVLNKSYKQVSLFFENDKAAHAAAEKLQAAGYIAVPSDTTYEPNAFETIVAILGGIMSGVSWILAILFLAFFINLCTARTIDAFKDDMAIMRSMGIQVKTIRVAMYVRMLIALVPSILVLALLAVLIFTSPEFNGIFGYLYPWQYTVIVLGMLALTVRTTHKQIHRLFGESVKKSLKGGADK